MRRSFLSVNNHAVFLNAILAECPLSSAADVLCRLGRARFARSASHEWHERERLLARGANPARLDRARRGDERDVGEVPDARVRARSRHQGVMPSGERGPTQLLWGKGRPLGRCGRDELRGPVQALHAPVVGENALVICIRPVGWTRARHPNDHGAEPYGPKRRR